MTTLHLTCPSSGAIQAAVPYLHVADVEHSLAFYATLGFTPGDRVSNPLGRTVWASALSQKAVIFFAQASAGIIPEQQAALLYLYSNDVAALRSHLLAAGLHDGGPFNGGPNHLLPNNGRRVAFHLAHPFYMPKGELRVADPDGYTLLIGQRA